MAKIGLKSLLVPSKATNVEFPGFDGLKLDLTFLSREELVKIRKKATKTVFENRQPVDKFDDELFLKLYVEGSVKGWEGFKLKYLNQLAPIDMTDQNPEDELEFSAENALDLMKASAEFDSFVSQTVTSLSAFTQTNGNS